MFISLALAHNGWTLSATVNMEHPALVEARLIIPYSVWLRIMSFLGLLSIMCYVSGSLTAVGVLLSLLTVNVSLIAVVCLREDPSLL